MTESIPMFANYTDVQVIATSQDARLCACGEVIHEQVCQNCKEAQLSDLEPMKMWLVGEDDPEAFDNN